MMTENTATLKTDGGFTRAWLLPVLTILWLHGCGTTPPKPGIIRPAPEGTRAQVVHVATDMLGVPYLYGGDTPRGFDCSGLVQFSYRQAGIHVPRTARQQYESTYPVALSIAQPGDLLFFRLNARVVSHVGIYIGDGRFIHAASQGKDVRVSSLDNSYWNRRLVRAGSIIPTPSQSARQ